jgi:hypothetical protein
MVDYPVSHTDRYLDDLCIGEVSTGGPIKISEAEIVALGKACGRDPTAGERLQPQ